jgi:hypothetical protein
LESLRKEFIPQFRSISGEEINRRRGSVLIKAQEGEKTAKITEKLPEGL